MIIISKTNNMVVNICTLSFFQADAVLPFVSLDKLFSLTVVYRYFVVAVYVWNFMNIIILSRFIRQRLTQNLYSWYPPLLFMCSWYIYIWYNPSATCYNFYISHLQHKHGHAQLPSTLCSRYGWRDGCHSSQEAKAISFLERT